MKISAQCGLLALLLLPVVVNARQASPATGDIHAEIQTMYDFQPHTLTGAQITQKSALLDAFWVKAKSQPELYAPALRRELADFSNPSFFFFDGSKLLLSLSNDAADRKIVLNAIVKSDLRDIERRDYFLLVHSMAAQGEDTTAAAVRILEDPKFQVLIPQHALTLAQNYCLIYMLLPTAQDFWIQPAIERLRNEKDTTAQKSLLLVLWYAQTPDADKAISEFSIAPGKPQVSQAYAIELLHRKDQTGKMTAAIALASNEESLRQARRDRMKAVSDEALYDLDSYTAKIIAKRK